MHIWIEQLQSQNTELVTDNKRHKVQPYIARLRLLSPPHDSPMSKKWLSVSELDSNWLKRASFTGSPGEIALAFRPGSTRDITTTK